MNCRTGFRNRQDAGKSLGYNFGMVWRICGELEDEKIAMKNPLDFFGQTVPGKVENGNVLTQEEKWNC